MDRNETKEFLLSLGEDLLSQAREAIMLGVNPIPPIGVVVWGENVRVYNLSGAKLERLGETINTLLSDEFNYEIIALLMEIQLVYDGDDCDLSIPIFNNKMRRGLAFWGFSKKGNVFLVEEIIEVCGTLFFKRIKTNKKLQKKIEFYNNVFGQIKRRNETN